MVNIAEKAKTTALNKSNSPMSDFLIKTLLSNPIQSLVLLASIKLLFATNEAFRKEFTDLMNKYTMKAPAPALGDTAQSETTPPD